MTPRSMAPTRAMPLRPMPQTKGRPLVNCAQPCLAKSTAGTLRPSAPVCSFVNDSSRAAWIPGERRKGACKRELRRFEFEMCLFEIECCPWVAANGVEERILRLFGPLASFDPHESPHFEFAIRLVEQEERRF